MRRRGAQQRKDLFLVLGVGASGEVVLPPPRGPPTDQATPLVASTAAAFSRGAGSHLAAATTPAHAGREEHPTEVLPARPDHLTEHHSEQPVTDRHPGQHVRSVGRGRGDQQHNAQHHGDGLRRGRVPDRHGLRQTPERHRDPVPSRRRRPPAHSPPDDDPPHALGHDRGAQRDDRSQRQPAAPRLVHQHDDRHEQHRLASEDGEREQQDRGPAPYLLPEHQSQQGEPEREELGRHHPYRGDPSREDERDQRELRPGTARHEQACYHRHREAGRDEDQYRHHDGYRPRLSPLPIHVTYA